MTEAAIDRVWKMLADNDLLPYSARVRDIVPEERPATEDELRQLQAADQEAEQKNREFCRKIVEIAGEYRISHVDGVDEPLWPRTEWSAHLTFVTDNQALVALPDVVSIPRDVHEWTLDEVERARDRGIVSGASVNLEILDGARFDG